MQERFGESIDAWSTSAAEWYYLAGVIGLALLAGLVPALKAYGTPVGSGTKTTRYSLRFWATGVP
ncbi:MAG: hypothetical protein AAGK78_10525, partial [Planctomycetota bacterium]